MAIGVLLFRCSSGEKTSRVPTFLFPRVKRKRQTHRQMYKQTDLSKQRRAFSEEVKKEEEEGEGV